MPDTKSQQERKYNCVYDKLVEDENDFTGMVAYALYKKEKIAYLEKIKTNKGQIKDEEVEAFHVASEVRLEGYKKEALSFTTDFVNDLIERKVKLSQELITDIIEKKAGPKGVKNWARAITQSLAAAIIYSIIVYVLLMFVWFKSSGNEDKARKTVQSTVEQVFTPKVSNEDLSQ